jgi:cytochrome c oxidase cbb3-type subunit 2
MKEYFATLVLIAALLIASQGRAQQDKAPAPKDHGGNSVYAELAKAPEKARAKRNPLENDKDAVAAGRNLFEQHCAECHGDRAEGGKKGPSLRAEEVQSAEPGAIFWLLTNGVVRKGMPVWSKLPEPQRWQLVRYLKSLGVATRAVEATPANPPPAGAKDSTLPRR